MNMSTKTIKISIDDLIDKFKKYNDNEEDIALIRRAYDYAEKKHFGQKRISGDDYILHPLNVALILTEISADAPCMAAALLHDTIEDSDATKEEIEEFIKNNYECRCNNCMSYFKSDDDLEDCNDEGELIKGCPKCKTDSYLMDLKN